MQTLNLPAGFQLSVIADAISSGNVYRLSDQPGAGDPTAPTAVAAGQTVTFGPFAVPARYSVDEGLVHSQAPAIGTLSAQDANAVAILGGTIKAQDVVVEEIADIALTIAPGTVVLTKATAGAYTLAAPAAGDDGLIMRIIAGTAAAHVVTATGLIEDGVTGGSKNTLTMAAFIGAGVIIEANNLKWHVLSLQACVVA